MCREKGGHLDEAFIDDTKNTKTVNVNRVIARHCVDNIRQSQVTTCGRSVGRGPQRVNVLAYFVHVVHMPVTTRVPGVRTVT